MFNMKSAREKYTIRNLRYSLVSKTNLKFLFDQRQLSFSGFQNKETTAQHYYYSQRMRYCTP